METYGIAAFRSRQQVMRLEAALKRIGLETQVVSTPRDVAVGCGLSLRFDIKDIDAVRMMITQQKPNSFIGLYRPERINGRSRLIAITKQE